MGPTFSDRWGADPTSTHVQIKPISIPDISVPLQLGRRDNFSLFLPFHRKMASRMIQIMMGKKNQYQYTISNIDMEINYFLCSYIKTWKQLDRMVVYLLNDPIIKIFEIILYHFQNNISHKTP